MSPYWASLFSLWLESSPRISRWEVLICNLLPLLTYTLKKEGVSFFVKEGAKHEDLSSLKYLVSPLVAHEFLQPSGTGILD